MKVRSRSGRDKQRVRSCSTCSPPLSKHAGRFRRSRASLLIRTATRRSPAPPAGAGSAYRAAILFRRLQHRLSKTRTWAGCRRYPAQVRVGAAEVISSRSEVRSPFARPSPKRRLASGQPILGFPVSQDPEFPRVFETPLFEEPRRKRESEVEAYDHRGVTLCFGHEEIGDLLPAATILQTHQSPVVDFGEPDRIRGAAASAGPIDGDGSHRHPPRIATLRGGGLRPPIPSPDMRKSAALTTAAKTAGGYVF